MQSENSLVANQLMKKISNANEFRHLVKMTTNKLDLYSVQLSCGVAAIGSDCKVALVDILMIKIPACDRVTSSIVEKYS